MSKQPVSPAFLNLVLCLMFSSAQAEPFIFGDAPQPARAYKSYEVKSQYVTMRDGVKLAVDVLLPAGLPKNDQVPALVYQTSFWRSVEVRWPFNHLHGPDPLQVYFVNQGYAVVLVDVRGTGASFGSRLYPWHQEELDDGREVVDWVVAQPWSNGLVGAFGAGYEGTTAELLAASNHPAVKAVMPMYSEFDTFTETAFPGGIFNEWFVRKWSQFNVQMCNNELPKEVGRVARSFARGVSPVAGDDDRNLLVRAIREHDRNLNLYDLARKVVCRDTKIQVGDLEGSIQDFTVFNHRSRIQTSGVAVFAWGSWMNGASADSVIRRFLTYTNPCRGVIGPWNKGGTQNASPYATSSAATPSVTAQYAEALAFFNEHLRDHGHEAKNERILHYYTMGEERWKSTTVWPPPGFEHRRFYLGPHGLLSSEIRTGDSGAERCVVDMQATTGNTNRWHSHLLGEPVVYKDRRDDDTRLLTYATNPLDRAVEITGHPVVWLEVTSTADDGAYYIYLEEVAPDGTVTYLTEGQLRALHRKVSDEAPPYTLLTPYHSFLEKDTELMSPGVATTMTFGLLPTSVRIPPGHRLRVAIAGHDAGTFARIPAENTPIITVGHTSWIDIPMKSVALP